MTTITADSTSSASTTSYDGRVTWKRGLLTGLGAAAVATAVAGGFSLADHPLSVVDADGASGVIPVLAFAQLVLVSAVIGLVIARRTSRRTFLRTTVALTALSCVPSVAFGTTVVDKLGLVAVHLVTAAIVIPRLARR